jgi:hypothetical protein
MDRSSKRLVFPLGGAAVEGHNDLVGEWVSKIRGAMVRELDDLPAPEC